MNSSSPAQTETMDRTLGYLTLGSLAVYLAASPFSISLTTIAVILGATAWVVHVLRAGSWRQVRWPLGLPFLCYYAACLAAVLMAEDVSHSLSKIKKLSEPLIFFWIVNAFNEDTIKRYLPRMVSRLFKKGAALRTDEVWSGLIHIWFIAAMVSATFAYYQHFIIADPSPEYRTPGPFSSPMTYGGLLMMAALMMMSRLLFSLPRRPLLILLFLVTFGALLIASMRSAWLAFFIGGMFLLVLKNRMWAAAAPLVVVVLLALSPPFIKDRILTVLPTSGNPSGLQADKSYNHRIQIWRAGWALFKEHPVFGCGFDCAYVVRDRYPDHPILKQFTTQHNNLLQLLVDVGVLGTGAWLFVWIQFFLDGSKKMRMRNKTDPDYWIPAGALAGIIAFHVVGIFESNFFDTEIAFVLYFLMALLWVVAPSSSQRSSI